MKTVVMAGGEGVRLRPFTMRLPKMLMPLGEQTLLEVLLQQLARAGVEEALLCVRYQAALIHALIGTGERYGLRVTYCREEVPLGTAGPLRAVMGELPERFLVVNGDVLCDLDFKALFDDSAASGAALTVAVHEQTTCVDFGVLTVDAERRVRGFKEKPVYKSWVNMGVYAMSRDVLHCIPEGRAFGMDELIQLLLGAGRSVTSFPFAGRWVDIGRREDFERAQSEFDLNRKHYLPK